MSGLSLDSFSEHHEVCRCGILPEVLLLVSVVIDMGKTHPWATNPQQTPNVGKGAPNIQNSPIQWNIA